MWGGSKSWYTLGHPCIVICEMVSLVCEVSIRLVFHKPISSNDTNLELFNSQNSLQSYGSSVPKQPTAPVNCNLQVL